jgi:hypothetical protein
MAEHRMGCFETLLIFFGLIVVGMAILVSMMRVPQVQPITERDRFRIENGLQPAPTAEIPARVQIQDPYGLRAQENPNWFPVIEEIIVKHGKVEQFQPIISHPLARSTEIALRIPELAQEVIYVTRSDIENYWVLVIRNSKLEKKKILPIPTHRYLQDHEKPGCFTEFIPLPRSSAMYGAIIKGCRKDFMVMSTEAAREKGVSLKQPKAH